MRLQQWQLGWEPPLLFLLETQKSKPQLARALPPPIPEHSEQNRTHCPRSCTPSCPGGFPGENKCPWEQLAGHLARPPHTGSQHFRFFQLVVLTCFSFHLVFSEQNYTDSPRGPLGNDLGLDGSGDKLVCMKVAELEESSSLGTCRLAVLQRRSYFRRNDFISA